MNVENMRVNVDSAKKKACLQHMDYDNFRQMVLGANLMPSKKGALVEMVDNHPARENISYHSMTRIIGDRTNQAAAEAMLIENGFDLEVVRETLQMQESENLHAPRNQEEFEKFVSKKCTDSMQRYTYMRLVSQEHYKTLFTREFDSDLLLLLMKTFKEQVFENEEFNNTTEHTFILFLLDLISKTPNFSFVLSFLEEKQLAEMKEILEKQLNKCEDSESLEKLKILKEIIEDA